MASWRARVSAVGGDLWSTLNATFAPQIVSARDLHDLAEAMGIWVRKSSDMGAAGHGISPPWAVVCGDPVSQPGLCVTWKLGPPQQTTTFQLNTKRKTLSLKGRRSAMEAHLELLLTFLGPPLEVASPGAPPRVEVQKERVVAPKKSSGPTVKCGSQNAGAPGANDAELQAVMARISAKRSF